MTDTDRAAHREEIARLLHDADTGSIVPDNSDAVRYAAMADAVLDRALWLAERELWAVLNRTVALDSDPSAPPRTLAASVVSHVMARLEAVTGERPAVPWEPAGAAAVLRDAAGA